MADPVATNPEFYSVAFENDRVRVLVYSDHPGDRTQAHEHPDSVMVTASSFERRLHHDGHSVDVTIPAGTVRWLDAQEHSGENIGVTDSVVFFIELKEPSPSRTPGQASLGPSPRQK